MDPNDITLLAADRLEAALERLALAFQMRERSILDACESAIQDAREAGILEGRAEMQRGAEPGPQDGAPPQAGPRPQAEMVQRAEVEALSARLDEALGRLRALLGDDAGAEI